MDRAAAKSWSKRRIAGNAIRICHDRKSKRGAGYRRQNAGRRRHVSVPPERPAKRSESKAPDRCARIGKDDPQWVPEPGFENLIIRGRKYKRGLCETMPRPPRRPPGDALSETSGGQRCRPIRIGAPAQQSSTAGGMIGMHAAPGGHHVPQHRPPKTLEDRPTSVRASPRPVTTIPFIGIICA